MDERRLDGLARALASTKTRRGYLAVTLGVLGAAVLAVRGSTQASLALCRKEGESCTLLNGCCSGNTCVHTSLFNPTVGVCKPGGAVTTTPNPRTPTATPRPTSTPSPTPTGRTIQVPLTIRLNCAGEATAPPPPQQGIDFIGHFGRRRRFQIDVISFTSFRQQGVGRGNTPGPSLSRRNRAEFWRWRCDPTAPTPGTDCISRRGFFDNRFGTDGATFLIRYERRLCEASVSCAQGSNSGGELTCVLV